ncbi:NIPSNAP family protein [Actinoplanes sp. NPDC048791]|uniref:NIPSNAP family protein n=1 Tax=Actinoplanes sp. NPDC048791 TaxID=3154623 RepID=UPI0033DCF55B
MGEPVRDQQNAVAADLAGCDVVEMRRYTLRPGTFDELQEAFQRWFVDGLERSGMRLGGQFRDRDDPDRFVWFRGFTSMAQRHEALEDFYLGPVWQEHRDAANATMIDSDDVLLLRPTSPAHRPGHAVAAGAPGPTADPAWAITLAWSLPAGSDLEAALTGRGHEVLERALGVPVAMWRTEPSANTFPRLPVRDGNHVVALAVFAGWEQWSQAEKRLGADAEWQRLVERLGDAELMRLEPTATSRHPRPIPA